ncbi:glycosyltransferase [Nocardioides sp. MH1]|uniref:glycosyltransferase n=1 Tax=Nocardioides sp. MH1 TaxID=3242490 RepID=UPI0035220D6E
MTADVSAVLVATGEGPRAGIALHGVLDAAAAARSAGLAVEVVVLLADASSGTRAALGEAAEHGARLETIGVGELGAARNYAVAAATGRYVALLDAGGLCSANWLHAAHAVAEADPERTVVHPEVHWFYEQGRELYFPPDQADPGFDPAMVALGNCWDAQTFAAAEVHRAVPHPELDAGAEPGDLDWAWTRATLAAGLRHRLAPDTLSFRRRRPRTLR